MADNPVLGVMMRDSPSAATYSDGKLCIIWSSSYQNNIHCSITVTTDPYYRSVRIERAGYGAWADTVVPGATLTGSPSIVCYKDQIYLFHQGAHSSGELYWNVLKDGQWQGDRRVPDVWMTASPSAVVFDNHIYVFHQGSANSGQLWYCILDPSNGTWSKDNLVQLAGLVESPSAAVTSDGHIFVFYQGLGYKGELYWSQYLFADGWLPSRKVPGVGMSSSPCAIYVKNDKKDEIRVYHQAYGDQSQIYCCTYSNWQWSSDQAVANGEIGTSCAPGACQQGNTVYLFYRGAHDSDELRFRGVIDS